MTRKMGVSASSPDRQGFWKNAEIWRKIAALSYSDFIANVEHLNLVAEQHVDPHGKRLMFAIRPNSTESIMWKATARIDCYKVNCQSCSIETTRILTLNEFVALYHQIILHINSASVDPDPQLGASAASSTSDTRPKSVDLGASVILAEMDALGAGASMRCDSDVEARETSLMECCICMERKSSIILPCSHTYCEKCIDSWWERGEDHQSCPLCRQKIKDKGEQWVLMSERPPASEVEKEVSSCVVGLAANVGRPLRSEEEPG